MLWKNRITQIGFGILFLAFCSVLSSSPSYAIDDISVTYHSGDTITRYSDVFPTCNNLDCLSQFSYFKVVTAGVDGAPQNFQFRVYPDGVLKTLFVSALFDGVYSISNLTGLQWSQAPSLSYDFTFILTNDLGSPQECSICETCQVCPAISENPYDDKLESIKHAILVVPAVMLVLYFLFCVYQIIVKGAAK